MREQFGLRSKQQSVMYKTPYPSAYDQIPLPHKYKMPDFTKFSGQGEVSTLEHVNRFLLQLGEAAREWFRGNLVSEITSIHIEAGIEGRTRSDSTCEG